MVKPHLGKILALLTANLLHQPLDFREKLCYFIINKKKETKLVLYREEPLSHCS